MTAEEQDANNLALEYGVLGSLGSNLSQLYSKKSLREIRKQIFKICTYLCSTQFLWVGNELYMSEILLLEETTLCETSRL